MNEIESNHCGAAEGGDGGHVRGVRGRRRAAFSTFEVRISGAHALARRAAPALCGISLRRAVNFRYAPKSKLIESWESEKDGEI